MGFIYKNGKKIKSLKKGGYSGGSSFWNYFSQSNGVLTAFTGRKVTWEIQVEGPPSGHKKESLTLSRTLFSGEWDDKPPLMMEEGDHIYFIASKKAGYYGVEGKVTISVAGKTNLSGGSASFKFDVPYKGANYFTVNSKPGVPGLLVYPTQIKVDERFAQHYYTKIKFLRGDK